MLCCILKSTYLHVAVGGRVCTANRSVGHLMAVFALGSCTSNSISSVVSSIASGELQGIFGCLERGGREGRERESHRGKRGGRIVNIIYSFQSYCHSCQTQFCFKYLIFLVIVEFLPQDLSLTHLFNLRTKVKWTVIWNLSQYSLIRLIWVMLVKDEGRIVNHRVSFQ